MTVRSGFKIKEREGVNRLSFSLTRLERAPTQDFSFLTVANRSLSQASRRSQILSELDAIAPQAAEAWRKYEANKNK